MMRHEERIITTDDAQLQTVTIEIKAIMVNRKQMTLAVFRQLKDEPLVDLDTGEVHGMPWGTVNYHPGCYQAGLYRGVHEHVIWQKGNELRQSLLQKYPGRLWPGDVCIPVNRERQAWWVDFYNRFVGQLPQLFIAV